MQRKFRAGRADISTVDGATSPCPACGVPLHPVVAPGGRRYLCPSCELVVLGLPVLRTAVGQPTEAAVWLASESVAPAGRTCPFCAQAMRPVTAPPGPSGPAQAEVCRACQMVAVAADQWPLLAPGPTAAPSPAASGAAGSTVTSDLHCPNCGAPREPAADNCCRYCHAPFSVEPQVVFVPTPVEPDLPVTPTLDTTVRFLSALARKLG